MTNIYTEQEYSKSYTELIEILKHIEEEDLIKIPKYIIYRYISDRDKEYNFVYNPKLSLEEQNVSKLTQILFANLYIEYLAAEEERERLKNRDKQELSKLENNTKERYNIDNIFYNKAEKDENINDRDEVKSLTVINNKNFIAKIINKIKKFFKH